ncbi:MAG: pilus assembly protein PilP [Gammaproteobacteria bacterium]
MSYQKQFLHYTMRGAFVATALLLSGCSSDDLSDLQAYVAEVLSRKGGTIDPLPEIKPYERYLYQSGEAGARDPFEPFFEMKRGATIERNVSNAQKKYIEEIETHNPEELENFELDGLRMVGTLQNSADFWGVVLDQEGTVHRVKVGNYMGKNFGKIINVAEDKIEVREIIGDGQGSWEERAASLALLGEDE